MACHREPALGEMYALVRSQGLLEGRLRALAHQVSDANLQQMPDFQQRVDVLRRLEYIADDNTVQLKVSHGLDGGTALPLLMHCVICHVHYTSHHMHCVTRHRALALCESSQGLQA